MSGRGHLGVCTCGGSGFALPLSSVHAPCQKHFDGSLLPRKHFHDVSFLFLLNKTNKDFNKTDGSFPFHPNGWEAQWHWNLITIISMLKFKCAYFIIFLGLILYNLILLVLLL